MSAPLKVLQLAKHFHPDTGGIETVTKSIADMLVPHDILADVLCTQYQGDYAPFDGPYKVYRERADFGFGNKRVSLNYVRQIAALESEYDAAIVHLPNPIAVAGALAFWRKPIIGLWHADIPQLPIRLAAAPFDQLFIDKAKAIIGPTQVHIDHSFHAGALAKKSVAIFLPFDANRLPKPDPKSAFSARLNQFAAGRKLGLSIGRLVPYKGYDVLLRALSNGPKNVAVAIVGSGPLAENLAKQIEALGLENQVLLLGGIFDQELADAIGLADFGLMPSVSKAEMYGVAQVEMMAAGKPVIATNLVGSGVPLVNRDNVTGLIVPPSDEAALADAIEKIANDGALCARLAKGAAQSFLEEHSLAAIGSRYATLIREIIAGKKIENIGPKIATSF